jgi:hypothetical protein
VKREVLESKKTILSAARVAIKVVAREAKKAVVVRVVKKALDDRTATEQEDGVLEINLHVLGQAAPEKQGPGAGEKKTSFLNRLISPMDGSIKPHVA